MKNLKITHKALDQFASLIGGNVLVFSDTFLTLERLKFLEEPVEELEDPTGSISVNESLYARAGEASSYIMYVENEKKLAGPDSVQIYEDEDDRSNEPVVLPDTLTIQATTSVAGTLAAKLSETIYILESGELYDHRPASDNTLEDASGEFVVSRVDYTNALLTARNTNRHKELDSED